MGHPELESPDHAPSAAGLPSPGPSAVAALAARRGLFLHLTADYPTLPLRLVLAAVGECERAILLCGDGPAERATMEVVARQNLDELVAVQGRRRRSQRSETGRGRS